VPGTATAYSGPITITQTTVLTARRQLPATTRVFTGMAAIGTNWSGLMTRVYLVDEAFATRGDISVAEINYHPLAPTAAESALLPGVTADDFEFIELENVGGRKVNLFEVKFTDTRPFKELKLPLFRSTQVNAPSWSKIARHLKQGTAPG
jgi:hypothetical protein